ncbi:MAG TPA: UDP-glucose/GDP-mannose dehydrogenase family protein [Streptosporangiaceae bacterium]|jgi:UDPglucose 6-dehydrogenase|nr:UDP-glucose/GDP-mannose dehydrogenase family protein [Streptosporangiaceae bacterium]
MSGMLRLTVLGAGYLGITHAACMASLGFEVLGVDTDQGKVDQLNAGHLPIYEPGLRELLGAGLDARRVRFTTSYQSAAEFGDVHFICAGTPQRPGSNHADLSQVHACVATLAPLLDRPCLVVGKSTVPVGTARRLAAELSRACPGAELAWNPEFLREGTAVADTLSPARIVVGVTSGRAEEILRQVYSRPLAGGTSFTVTSLETAELAKAAANAFLATKISFINAMAEICEAAGGDVRALAHILGADSRIGPAFLRAGLGYGGGCLPKDIRAFVARAEELGCGASLAFLREVDGINLRRRARTADLALELAGGNLAGVPVCVLGAAFKPGSDDVRDSPALDVAQILTGMGARVTVYDPAALGNARRIRPELSYADTLAAAARGAHVVLLLTEWPEFTALTPDGLGRLVARRNIIDARNVIDPGTWREAGWDYRALGVGDDAEPARRSAGAVPFVRDHLTDR